MVMGEKELSSRSLDLHTSLDVSCSIPVSLDMDLLINFLGRLSQSFFPSAPHQVQTSTSEAIQSFPEACLE